MVLHNLFVCFQVDKSLRRANESRSLFDYDHVKYEFDS